MDSNAGGNRGIGVDGERHQWNAVRAVPANAPVMGVRTRSARPFCGGQHKARWEKQRRKEPKKAIRRARPSPRRNGRRPPSPRGTRWRPRRSSTPSRDGVLFGKRGEWGGGEMRRVAMEEAGWANKRRFTKGCQPCEKGALQNRSEDGGDGGSKRKETNLLDGWRVGRRRTFFVSTKVKGVEADASHLKFLVC